MKAQLDNDIARPYANSTAGDLPWPVAVLTGIGAWLAALPLAAGLHFMLSPSMGRGITPYLIGTGLLFAGAVVLRVGQPSIFREQFAVAALILVGAIFWGIALEGDLNHAQFYFALTVESLLIAFILPKQWMRAACGAAGYFSFIYLGSDIGSHDATLSFVFDLFPICLWIAGHLVMTRHTASGRFPVSIGDAILTGWVVAMLLQMVRNAYWMSYYTFGYPREMDSVVSILYTLKPLVFYSFAALIAGREWPELRSRRWLAAALVGAGLALIVPNFGSIALIIAIAAITERRLIAGAGFVAAIGISIVFYFNVNVALGTKSLILCVAGIALLLLSHKPAIPVVLATPAPLPQRLPKLSIVVTAAAVLTAVNFGIVRNELHISSGKPVFIALAPVDPRSIMQGDYMALNFQLPEDAAGRQMARMAGTHPPDAIGRLRNDGVTELYRYDDGSPLRSEEIRIKLVQTRFGWGIGTDAWFFAEGQGAPFETARYGEFRVDTTGRAMLVSMRDAHLKKIP